MSESEGMLGKLFCQTERNIWRRILSDRKSCLKNASETSETGVRESKACLEGKRVWKRSVFRKKKECLEETASVWFGPPGSSSG